MNLNSKQSLLKKRKRIKPKISSGGRAPSSRQGLPGTLPQGPPTSESEQRTDSPSTCSPTRSLHRKVDSYSAAAFAALWTPLGHDTMVHHMQPGAGAGNDRSRGSNTGSISAPNGKEEAPEHAFNIGCATQAATACVLHSPGTTANVPCIALLECLCCGLEPDHELAHSSNRRSTAYASHACKLPSMARGETPARLCTCCCRPPALKIQSGTVHCLSLTRQLSRSSPWVQLPLRSRPGNACLQYRLTE